MTYNLRSDHIRNWIISTSTEQRITEQKPKCSKQHPTSIIEKGEGIISFLKAHEWYLNIELNEWK